MLAIGYMALTLKVKRRGLMVGTSYKKYTGISGFKSQPVGQLYWVLFEIFFSLYLKISVL
jgi:hypothetical protein